jgi:hypothetical protein
MKKIITLHNYFKNNSFYKEALDLISLANELSEEESSEGKSELISDEELLSLLINDDLYFLDPAQRDELENWDGIKSLLDRVGAEYTQLKKMGEPTDFYKVELSNGKVYIVDSNYPEFKGNDLKSWVQDMIDSNRADEWVREIEVDPPGIVYHGTREENLSDILEDGLGCRSDSRGMTNRSVGCAIFTSSEASETEHYGDILFEIDLAAMERDGVLPRVSLEPPIEEYEMYSSFAAMFGLSLGDDVIYDIEHGMSQNTFILHGPVPPKYLKVVS